jgi:hypothetical protein
VDNTRPTYVLVVIEQQLDDERIVGWSVHRVVQRLGYKRWPGLAGTHRSLILIGRSHEDEEVALLEGDNLEVVAHQRGGVIEDVVFHGAGAARDGDRCLLVENPIA